MNETKTIHATCRTEGCDRPISVQKAGLCRICYARKQNQKHRDKYRNLARQASPSTGSGLPSTPPPGPSLPQLPKSAPEEQRETLRLIYFACYRQMRFAPDYAARCAGYPAPLVEQEGFLAGLDRQAEASGALALLDVPNRLLYATQRHANFANMVLLRDQREDLKVSLAAAKLLANLDNEHAFNPQEIADEEMADWSKEDLIRYIRDGAAPKLRPRKPPLQVFAEDAQTTEPDPVAPGGDAGDKEDDHPDRGMLA